MTIKHMEVYVACSLATIQIVEKLLQGAGQAEDPTHVAKTRYFDFVLATRRSHWRNSVESNCLEPESSSIST